MVTNLADLASNATDSVDTTAQTQPEASQIETPQADNVSTETDKPTAGFGAWMDLLKSQREDSGFLSQLSDKLTQTDKFLAEKGYSEAAGLLNSYQNPTDPNRVALRDQLVQQYNEENPNSPIATSGQTIDQLKQSRYASVLSKYNFYDDTHSKLSNIWRWAGSKTASLVNSVETHPLAVAGSLIGTVGIETLTGGLFTPLLGEVGSSIAASALSGGIVGGVGTYAIEKNMQKQIDADPNLDPTKDAIREALNQGLVGAVGGAAVPLFSKASSFVWDAAEKAVPVVKKYFSSGVAPEAEDAGIRAAAYDIAKNHKPDVASTPSPDHVAAVLNKIGNKETITAEEQELLHTNYNTHLANEITDATNAMANKDPLQVATHLGRTETNAASIAEDVGRMLNKTPEEITADPISAYRDLRNIPEKNLNEGSQLLKTAGHLLDDSDPGVLPEAVHPATMDLLSAIKSKDPLAISKAVEQTTPANFNEDMNGFARSIANESPGDMNDIISKDPMPLAPRKELPETKFPKELVEKARVAEAQRSTLMPEPSGIIFERGVTNPASMDILKKATQNYGDASAAFAEYDANAMLGMRNGIRKLLKNEEYQTVADAASGKLKIASAAKLDQENARAVSILRTGLTRLRNAQNDLDTLKSVAARDGTGYASTIRNAVSTRIETLRAEASDVTNMGYRDIDGIIKKGSKNKNTTIRDLDREKLLNSLMTKDVSSASGVEAAVANRAKLVVEKHVEKALNYGDLSGVGEKMMPNLFDPRKVAKLSRKEFIDLMLPRVDVAMMKDFAEKNNYPIQNIQELLGRAYDRMIANQSARTIATKKGDLLYTGDRIIHFKDAKSWLEVHDLVGRTSESSGKISSDEILSRYITNWEDVHVRSGLGNLNTKEKIDAYVNSIANKMKATAAKKSLKQVSKLDDFATQYKSVLSDINGLAINPAPLGPLTNKAISITRNSMLSGSSITAFLSDKFGGMAVLASRIGARNPILSSMIDYLGRLSKEELQDVVRVNEVMAAHGHTILRNSMLGRSLSAVANLGRTTMSSVAKMNETTAQLTFMKELAKNAGKTFEELHPRLRTFLRDVGISADNWETYRVAPKYEFSNGLKVLSSKNLENFEEAVPFDVRQKFAAAETHASMIGSPRSTAFGKSYTVSPGLSYPAQIAAKFYEPFANIAQTVHNYHMGSLHSIYEDSGLGSAAVAGTQMILGGFLTYHAKQLLAGRRVGLFDPKALAGAIAYSGLLPAYIDSFARAAFSGNFDDPIPKKVLEQIASGKITGSFGLLRNTALAVNPLRNYGILGELIQKETLDRLYAAMDPQGAIEYNNNLYNQLQNGKIYKWRYNLLKIKR